MGKALKPLVIVLLLLSIISLVLGSLLFSKREILKGRTQKLERAASDVARKLASAQDPFIAALEPQSLDADQLKNYAAMDVPLNQLRALAENRYEELNTTKMDLDVTRTELAQTKEELAATREELAVAQNQIVELNATIEQKDAEIAQANSRIDQLEQDKEALQAQIDDLNTQLAKADDEIRDLQDQVATLDRIIKTELEKTQPKLIGLTGRVLVVNPEWNFVVLDVGRAEGLVTSTEMHVHRADQLVGKVRVTSVEENMAVADIVKDWEQVPLKEGDSVLIF